MDDQGYPVYDSGNHELASVDSELQGRRRDSRGSGADSGHGRTPKAQQRGVHFMEGAGNTANASTLPLGDSTSSALDQSAPSPKSPPVHGKELTTELDSCSPLLSQAQASAIDQAIRALFALVQPIVSSCSRSSGSADATGELLPLGSYALGVNCPGDTVDFVCLVPQQVSLRDLLTKLQSALRESHEATFFCDASADGELKAPGLILTWSGLSILLLLARNISDLPLASSSGIVQDTAGAVSREICETILKSVPNRECFAQLLRFVRFWAKRRGIYGSNFGFFTGTAWAICCATVCQQNQRVQLPQLVGHFFRMLSRWDWAQPVSIMPADGRQPQVELSPEEYPMPVLLPASSGLVATWNVSPTTMKILQKEFRRGFKTVKQVELGRVHWSDVYNSTRFFQRHRHYLEFAFMAASQEVFDYWCVWARKQAQTIVKLFESTSNDIVSLRPWPQWLPFKDVKWNHAHAIFFGLHLERGKDGQHDGGRRSFDLREPIVKFLESTALWPDAEMYVNQFELEIRHVKNDQLQIWLENREKGVLAHGQGMQPPAGGLVMQSLGEKVSVCELPLGDELDDNVGGDSA